MRQEFYIGRNLVSPCVRFMGLVGGDSGFRGEDGGKFEDNFTIYVGR